MTVPADANGATPAQGDASVPAPPSVGGSADPAAGSRWINPLQQFTLGWDIFPMLGGRKGIYAHHILGDPALEIGPPPKREHDLTTPTNWGRDSGWSRLTIEQVRAYWPGDGRHNIGVATGRRSGVWVLDVDVILDTEAEAREYVAEMTGIEIPQTLSVRTASGKWHFYFKMPESPDIYIKSSVGKLAPNVDVRGDGGMAMGICSSVTDADGATSHYEVATMAAPVYAPLALIDRVKAKDADAVDAPVASAEKRVDAKADRTAQPWIEAELQKLHGLPRPWHEGARWHDTCFEVACQLAEFANSEWCSLTAEDARRRYFEAAPAPERDWNPAKEWGQGVMKTAGQARPMPKVSDEADAAAAALMAAAPARPSAASPQDQADIGGEMRAKAQARQDDEDDDLWITHKNGAKSLDIPEAASRVVAADPMLADAAGGLWVYRDGAFTMDSRHVGRAMADILGRRWTPAHVTNVEKRIRTMADLLDFNEVAHPNLVNFRNGMVDWRTGDRHDHDPAHRSTFQVNADWDPAAECPLFSRYVDTMLEPEAAVLLWEVIGYSMLSGNPMQVFVFLEGPGGNGKGVVQRMLVNLLGPSNVSSLSMAEIDGDNRFKLSSMVGRAANISGETPKTHIGDSSNLKKVTGGDWVDVERKGVDSVQVRIHALPIFSVNEVPSLGDDSEGLFQRAIVIPFHRSSSEHPIPNFDESAFAPELAGIARRGVEAIRAIRMDSPALRANGFSLGATGARAREDFREQANAELDWVNNYLRPDSDHWMTPTELYRAFGSQRPRPSRKFMRALRERFGAPVTAVPSSLSRWVAPADHPLKNARVNCYGVRVSEDRIDTVRELLGVPGNQEAS